MNLSYTLPNAEKNIIAGVKLHTLREDKGGRWQPGLKIHHSYSFRSKKGYSCFLINECKSVQRILIMLQNVYKSPGLELQSLVFRVDRVPISTEDEERLIKNDGFDNRLDFMNWFFPADKKGKRKNQLWAGKIIHWTDLKY